MLITFDVTMNMTCNYLDLLAKHLLNLIVGTDDKAYLYETTSYMKFNMSGTIHLLLST